MKSSRDRQKEQFALLSAAGPAHSSYLPLSAAFIGSIPLADRHVVAVCFRPHYLFVFVVFIRFRFGYGSEGDEGTETVFPGLGPVVCVLKRKVDVALLERIHMLEVLFIARFTALNLALGGMFVDEE